MDKDLSKLLMVQNQVLTPQWEIIDTDTENINEDDYLSQVELPFVIKPCSCGSSVGVSMVRSNEKHGLTGT